jgi:hypothetical protein
MIDAGKHHNSALCHIEDPPVHRRLDSWFPTLTGVSRLVVSA